MAETSIPSKPDQQPDPRVDAAGVVVADMACVGCDYNLRSLTLERNCPECGRPVSESLSERKVWYQDDKRLELLTLGITLVLIELLVLILISIASLITWTDKVVVLGALGLFFVSAAGTLGCLVLAAVGRSGLDRRSIRAGHALTCLALFRAFLGVATFGTLALIVSWDVRPQLTFSCFLATLLALSPLMVVLDIRLRRLEEQVHQSRLVHVTTWSFWTMAVSWLVFCTALPLALDAGVINLSSRSAGLLGGLSQWFPIDLRVVVPVAGGVFVASSLMSGCLLLLRLNTFDTLRRKLAPKGDAQEQVTSS